VRLLVTGGRTYDEFQTVMETLDRIHEQTPVALLIHGGAYGADTLAGRWAKGNGVPTAVYKAQWKAHGPAAGPIRNQQMITEAKPDAYYDFPGGRGTSDTRIRCIRAGVPRALPEAPGFIEEDILPF
jgi:hypothetical protein